MFLGLLDVRDHCSRQTDSLPVRLTAGQNSQKTYETDYATGPVRVRRCDSARRARLKPCYQIENPSRKCTGWFTGWLRHAGS